MLCQPIQDGVRSGAITSICSAGIVANAPKIISDMRAFSRRSLARS